MTVAPKTISITGDTSSGKSSEAFCNAIKAGGLEVSKEGFKNKAGRDTFNIMVKPKE